MPTFIIRHPQDPEERAQICTLISILEKMHSLVTFDAICVVIPEGGPETPLLRSLASHEIGESELIVQDLTYGVVPESVAPEVPANQGIACEECGILFVKPRKDSRFCSKKCGQRAYLRERRSRENVENPKQQVARKPKRNGGYGDGSGVVHGKLTLGENR